MRFSPLQTLLLVGAAASASLCLAQAEESSTAKRWDIPDFYFTGISTFAHMEHVKWYVSSRLQLGLKEYFAPCSVSLFDVFLLTIPHANLSRRFALQSDPTFSRI
jgi:hypothetical protein